jgi:hypothetical protein
MLYGLLNNLLFRPPGWLLNIETICNLASSGLYFVYSSSAFCYFLLLAFVFALHRYDLEDMESHIMYVVTSSSSSSSNTLSVSHSL